MLHPDELITDSFAGGGGASTGIEMALGRSPDIAINHDEAALLMHATNHPATRHVREDVWQARLRELVAGRPVGLLWASPDCKHFSRAKGSKPVEKSIRSLAWVVVRWASQVKPRIIVLENVREFADWGPVIPQWECRCGWRGTEGQARLARIHRRCPRCDARNIRQTATMVPDPDKRGMTFRLFCNRLRGLGYRVAWKTLNAADFGSPTHRRRLFLVARCDGQPIVWPEPTHGDPKTLDAMPLFDRLKPWHTAAECIDWSIPCPSIFDRKKPLAEKTLRRIAMGIKRYVLENPRPFIVRCNHGGDHFRGQPLDQPLSTVTGSHGYAVATPFLTRCQPLDKPAFTLDTQPRGALAVASLIKHFGGVVGAEIDTPLPTTLTSGSQNQLLSAYIVKHYSDRVGSPADAPLPTTSARGTQNQLLAANLIRFNFDDAGVNVEAPLPTATHFNHIGLVYSFLVKYFGTAIGTELELPLPTVTGKARFGLVTVTVAGEQYILVDIGMRMLTPRELATAQGFPADYVLTGTKTSQIARIGNSVCPQVAAAIVGANVNSDVALTEVSA